MQVTAPSGRTYRVGRRWLPWRQRIPLDTELVVTLLAGVELVLRVALSPVAVLLRVLHLLRWVVEVRDRGARKEAAVVSREHVRGWGPSAKRMTALSRELEHQYVDPAASGFHVVVGRDPVALGVDATDNTRVYELDDRTAHPTLGTLVTAIRDGGRWVTVSGTPTTWVLRESSDRKRYGRPLAVFVLDVERQAVDVHPVGDLSFRVAKDGRFHLEYLLAQTVERTLELIAADPTGKRSLREDRQT